MAKSASEANIGVLIVRLLEYYSIGLSVVVVKGMIDSKLNIRVVRMPGFGA